MEIRQQTTRMLLSGLQQVLLFHARLASSQEDETAQDGQPRQQCGGRIHYWQPFNRDVFSGYLSATVYDRDKCSRVYPCCFDMTLYYIALDGHLPSYCHSSKLHSFLEILSLQLSRHIGPNRFNLNTNLLLCRLEANAIYYASCVLIMINRRSGMKVIIQIFVLYYSALSRLRYHDILFWVIIYLFQVFVTVNLTKWSNFQENAAYCTDGRIYIFSHYNPTYIHV